MLSLPIAFRSALGVFAPGFSRPMWPHVTVLRTGAVLAPDKRTVPAILRSMGRRAAPASQPSHRVLHRAVWSPRTASRLLLRLLYIHRVISHHFCEPAFWQPPHFGCTGTVGQHDAKRPDVSM